MLFSAERDFSATEWSGYTKRLQVCKQRIYHCFSTLSWRHSTFRIRFKKIFVVLFAMLCLMLMWKNTPVLFKLSSRPSFTCPPCETNKKETTNGIEKTAVKKDEPGLLQRIIGESTTVGPPPGLPPQMYMNNLSEPRPRVEYNLTPWKVLEEIDKPINASKCSNMRRDKLHAPEWSFVIMVKSRASNFDRRAAIRATWGRLYFLNGVRIASVFVIGAVLDPVLQENIQFENDEHGDILQFEGPDDYKNMPIKVLTAMQWASANLPKDYIYASSDDDFVVNFVNIIDFIRKQVNLQMYNNRGSKTQQSVSAIRESLPIYCVYYLDRIKGPNRDNTSKWYTSVEEYPVERLPPYCGGGFYLMPVAMTADLYEMSRVTMVLSMDDVWVTGILRQKLQRGDENVKKLTLPDKNRRENDLWTHLWGDYGTKKDIARLLPAAWSIWEKRVKKRPHCARAESVTPYPSANPLFIFAGVPVPLQAKLEQVWG
uniref:uncharacterized protein LOC100181857 n=1 Tax=Ciona intestinalis TaxID=7719 RepID=UPI000180BF9E|nr:uncharacterized protein LOC100181857 [Ciona intestinalis]|eukprot:XP_002120701.1 uncharacterized protein LOC100181857 [Ciona intestinalis]